MLEGQYTPGRTTLAFILGFSLSFLFTSDPLEGQSLEVIDKPPQPIVGYYDDGNDLEGHFNVRNNSGSFLKVGCFKKVIDTVQGSENRFCWSPTCYAPSTDTADAVRSISANGGVDSSFIGYHDPNSNPGVAAVEYCFYDTSNVSDSTCTILRYDATSSVSIEELSEGGGPSIRFSPNPAQEFLNVKLYGSKKGTIRLHSILGKTVLEREIQPDQKAIELDVRELNEGLLLLTFERADGRSITEKVMIKD